MSPRPKNLKSSSPRSLSTLLQSPTSANATSSPLPHSPKLGRKRRSPRKPDAPTRENRNYEPPVLNEAQRERKRVALLHFRNFAKEWQGAWYYSQPHDEMCDELEEAFPQIGTGTDPKKKIFLTPRYTYKTSLLLAFMAYVFLKYREMGVDAAIDYVRAEASLAQDVLFELKMNLESNPFIVELWGDLSKAAYVYAQAKVNWGRKRDVTISVSGLDRGAAGKHPDLVIFDDIVNEKNFESLVAKRKARTKIQAYYPVLPPWGSMLQVGTRFAFNDVTGWLLDQIEADARRFAALMAEGKPDEAKKYEPKWSVYIRAYDDGPDGKGSLYFPAVLTHEFVEYQKQILDPRLWAAWYLNQCVADGMQLFRAEYLQYFSGHYSPPDQQSRLIPTLEVFKEVNGRNFVVERLPVRVTMVIDPTITAKQRSDWTGINVTATDHLGRWWVLLGTHMLKPPSEVGEDCVNWIARYVPETVMIATEMADAEMVSRIRQGITDLGLTGIVSIRSYASKRDESAGEPGRPGRRAKSARIEAMEPRFRQRLIFLQRGACDALVDQYRHWPDVEHDDCFDAFSMQHLIAKKCRWGSVEDAELDLLPDEEDEEPGDLWRQYASVVRTTKGELLKITVSPFEDGDEPRVVGRSGLSRVGLPTRRAR